MPGRTGGNQWRPLSFFDFVRPVQDSIVTSEIHDDIRAKIPIILSKDLDEHIIFTRNSADNVFDMLPHCRLSYKLLNEQWQYRSFSLNQYLVKDWSCSIVEAFRTSSKVTERLTELDCCFWLHRIEAFDDFEVIHDVQQDLVWHYFKTSMICMLVDGCGIREYRRRSGSFRGFDLDYQSAMLKSEFWTWCWYFCSTILATALFLSPPTSPLRHGILSRLSCSLLFEVVVGLRRIFLCRVSEKKRRGEKVK